jgi:hypothetical protein
MECLFGEMQNAAGAHTIIIFLLLLLLLLLILLLLLLLFIFIFIIFVIIITIFLPTTLHSAIYFVQQLSHIACSVVAKHNQRPILLQVKPGLRRRAVPRPVVLRCALTVDVAYHPTAGVPARANASARAPKEARRARRHAARANAPRSDSRAVLLPVVIGRASVIQAPNIKQNIPQMIRQHGAQRAHVALHVGQTGKHVAVTVHSRVLPAHGNVLVPLASESGIAAIFFAATAIPAGNKSRHIRVTQGRQRRMAALQECARAGQRRSPFGALPGSAAQLRCHRVHYTATRRFSGAR